jgi:hypothetical protein
MKKITLIFVLALLSMSCRNTADKAEAYDNSQQTTIDSMKIEMDKQKAEMAKQKTIDSMKTVTTEKTKTVVVHDKSGTTTTVQEKRKGWSGAAKGAVIGAGVGAISGAVIDKKKPAQGAVIGGLAGAGLGAGTGAILDSEKKKKEAKK